MLLTKKVYIKAMNFRYYNSIGYNVKNSKEYFYANIEDLTNGSHTIVDVSCDYCGDVLSVPYKRYIKYTNVCDKYSCSKKECTNQKIKDVCLIKYNVENPFQADFVKEKSKKTLIKNYGVSHQMYSQEVKDKIKKTCLIRYGVDNPNRLVVQNNRKKTCVIKFGVEHDSKLPSQQLKRKNTRIKKGNQIPDNMLEPYILYRKQVDNMSTILKVELLNNWNGYDYYDNEYIKDNFNLKSSHKNYPTMDHKTSCYYGYLNNIPVSEIASLNNLCMTKNKLNAQKRDKNECEYKNKLKKDKSI